VPIYREEVFAKVSQQNKEALASAQGDGASGGDAMQLKFPKLTPAAKPTP
jgi:sRNA-binding carbon storage regulator CsrA